MFDLLGDPIPVEPEKTFREIYAEYINSARWKRTKEEKIKRSNYQCERCGISKWSVKLEVHHKTYERFKHERFEDLEVLCPECHALADKERKNEVDNKNEVDKSKLIIGFENWMDKGNNKNWRRLSDDYIRAEWKTFLYQIGKRDGKDYGDICFVRQNDWN